MEPLFVLDCATLAKRSVDPATKPQESGLKHQAFFTSM